MAIAAFSLGVRYNPLIDPTPLAGGPIVNALILGYLIPSVMAGLLAAYARKPRPLSYWGAAAALSLVLGFAFLVLAVRVLFQGQVIVAELGAGIAELGIDTAICLAVATLLAEAAGGEFAPWLKKASIAFAVLAA